MRYPWRMPLARAGSHQDTWKLESVTLSKRTFRGELGAAIKNREECIWLKLMVKRTSGTDCYAGWLRQPNQIQSIQERRGITFRFGRYEVCKIILENPHDDVHGSCIHSKGLCGSSVFTRIHLNEVRIESVHSHEVLLQCAERRTYVVFI